MAEKKGASMLGHDEGWAATRGSALLIQVKRGLDFNKVRTRRGLFS
jgi:hypothetical protein